MNINGNSMSKSRIETYYNCEMQYYIRYHLGIKGPSSAASSNGNVIHEVLQRYAQGDKNYTKNLLNSFSNIMPHHQIKAEAGAHKCHECPYMKPISDGETVKFFCSPENKDCDEVAVCPQIEFSKCLKMVKAVIEDESLPINKDDIIGVEQPFEFYVGDFKLKGIIDLLTRIDSKTLEVNDYKSGKASNAKNYKDAYEDIQLRIYYIAVRRIYPNYPNVLCTLNYLQKRPVTVAFDDSIIEPTINYVKKTRDEILAKEFPSFRIDLNNKRWKWLCDYCDRPLCDEIWKTIPRKGNYSNIQYNRGKYA